MSLQNFFNPRSIAIIGASSRPEKLGRQILDNVLAGGFRGKIYPINLKEETIAGLPAYSGLEKLPAAEYDSLLAVIAIPAPLVLAEVQKCADLGIKNLVIITAGFKETGGEGKKQEEAIAAIGRKHKMNILGPNCLGVINTWHNLNATFASADKETGNIALLSQSGAIGSASLDWLKIKDFNFGYFVSLGNKAVLDENDMLAYLARDDRIDLIVIYLEEIKNGERLMEIISRLAKRKPVAILKAGQSAAGGQLALSHTGALAGSNAAVKVGLERSGAIWLENIEELFNLLLLFRKESWHNQGVQDLHLITNAGGMAVLTVDEISRQNIPFGGSQDLLGDADAEKYKEAINQTLAKPEVNNLLVLLTPQTSTQPLLTAQALIEESKLYPHKLIAASFMGGEAVGPARALLAKNNIASFEYPEEAVRSFKKLISYKKNISNLRPYSVPAVNIKPALSSDDYLESLALLEKYKIPAVVTKRYSVSETKSYRYPAVLKIVGPDFLHKTDKGGVAVNLKNRAELETTAARLENKNKTALKNPLNYLIVQEQAEKFQEIILGFKHDISFGPVMMVGMGGIYAEIFKEIKLATSDLDFSAAEELIASLKNYPILNGARGQKKYDISALAKALINLARLANEHPEIKEADINPLFVFEHGVSAGDVRIIL